jgi:dihydrofolate synthase/folylpolyglutamate synthase
LTAPITPHLRRPDIDDVAIAAVSDPLTYLFSLEHLGIKLGLDQIRALVQHLGHPDRAYRAITVAGTNGKGSVTAMIERGLRAAGYRTGRYTSPHLVRVEERVAIDGNPIAAGEFAEVVERVRHAADRLPAPPSFFEATTAVALEAFRQARVDVAVLEVGLGGRLDATNVVCPMGVTITSIDFDHEQYLGDTIDAIAREKAGILKPGATAVIAKNPPAVLEVLRSAADDVGAPYVYAPDGCEVTAQIEAGQTSLSLQTPYDQYDNMALALRGRHQVDNAVAAVRTLEELRARRELEVSSSAIREALADVEWPARLELRRWRGYDVLIDGAHNPAGAEALASYLAETYGRRLPIVFGAMRDKKVDRVIRALAGAASCLLCTAAATSRAASSSDLAALAKELAPDVAVRDMPAPMTALAEAVTLGTPVVVAGSLYLAGEIRAGLS